jgi:PAS domain S-box-containing protein
VASPGPARRFAAADREGDREWDVASQLLELAPIAFVVTNRSGVILEANVAAGGLLGVEPRFMVGKPLAVYVVERREFLRLLRELEAADTATPVERELLLAARGDSPRHVAAAARKLPSEGGATVLAWALTDVHERVAAQVELRLIADELESRVRERTSELDAERSRLAAILDSMPAGVMVAEAPSGRIVLTNARAAQIVRMRALDAESVGDYSAQGIASDGTSIGPHQWPLARALESGEHVRSERILVQQDDETWIAIEASASPLADADGTVTAAIVVFWDVSERDRRERAEREFITNAAHDLQTPLTAIVSAVEVLKGGAKDIPEERERFLDHVDRESARLVRVVRSLLVLARAQLEHEKPPTTPMRLRTLLDEIALGLHPRAGIEVVVRCPSRLTVTTNRDMLEQAVGNLAANSARYTESGRIALCGRTTDVGVVVEVSDTGPGISDADVERLFGRFTRGGERSSEGFGLGLAIVRETVEVLGGSVSIGPRRGGGTIARIFLPDSGKVDA